MSKVDRIATDCPTTDCPSDVVDRLLWRNAQRILHRHVVRLDGTCHWCQRSAPCGPREMAQRADEVSRLPWHQAWTARNEVTARSPMTNGEAYRPGGARNRRTF